MIIEIGDFVEELDGRISGPVINVTDNLVYIFGKLSDCCIRKYAIKKVYKKPEFVEREQYILNPGDYVKLRHPGYDNYEVVVGPLMRDGDPDIVKFFFCGDFVYFNRLTGKSSNDYELVEKVNIVSQ